MSCMYRWICTQVVRRLQVPGTTVLPRSCITWSLPCVPGYRIFKNYNLLWKRHGNPFAFNMCASINSIRSLPHVKNSWNPFSLFGRDIYTLGEPKPPRSITSWVFVLNACLMSASFIRVQNTGHGVFNLALFQMPCNTSFSDTSNSSTQYASKLAVAYRTIASSPSSTCATSAPRNMCTEEIGCPGFPFRLLLWYLSFMDLMFKPKKSDQWRRSCSIQMFFGNCIAGLVGVAAEGGVNILSRAVYSAWLLMLKTAPTKKGFSINSQPVLFAICWILENAK